MEELTFTLFLDYLYNRFAVTFVLSIIGVVIRVMHKNVNARQKIDIGKVIASAFFSTILMCAVSEYIEIVFSIYALICVIVGIWSNKLIQIVMDSNFMGKVVIKYIKKIATPVAESLEETLKEENKKENDNSPEKDLKRKEENKTDEKSGG